MRRSQHERATEIQVGLQEWARRLDRDFLHGVLGHGSREDQKLNAAFDLLGQAIGKIEEAKLTLHKYPEI